MPPKKISKLAAGQFKRSSSEDIAPFASDKPDYPRIIPYVFDSALRRDLYPLQEAQLSGFLDAQGYAHLYFAEVRGLPALREHYAFKGGAVREFLRRQIYPSSARLAVRDYDIVRFATTPDTYDHEVAMQYMIDDYEYGHGVEII